MRIAYPHAVGLWAALIALAPLPACGAHGPSVAQPSTSATSSFMTAAPTTVAAPPSTRSARTEKWIDLQVGDCLREAPPTDPSVVTVTVVDCAEPHAAEAYSRAPVAVDAAIAGVADRACAAGFVGYTGRSLAGGPFSITYLIDSNQDRTSGNPDPSTVICLLQASNGQPMTRSARR